MRIATLIVLSFVLVPFAANAQPADYSDYPHLIGHLPLPGENQGIDGFELWGDDYFAVCNQDSGLVILRIDGESLTWVASIDLLGLEQDVRVVDWFAYVTTTGGLGVVNLVVPGSPLQAGFVHLAGNSPGHLEVSAPFAYVAGGPGGLLVVDVSNPSLMYVHNSYGGEVDSVWRDGARLGVTNNGRFELLDITAPIPALLGSAESVGTFDYHATVVSGDLVYALSGGQVDRWDFTVPGSPVLDPDPVFHDLPITNATGLSVVGSDLVIRGNAHLAFRDLDSGAMGREDAQIWQARGLADRAGLLVTTARDALMIHRDGVNANPGASGAFDPTGFMNPAAIMLGDILVGDSLTAPLTVTAADLNGGGAHLWDLPLAFGSDIIEYDQRGSLLSVLGGFPYQIRLVTASRYGATERGTYSLSDLDLTSVSGKKVQFLGADRLMVLDHSQGEGMGRILVLDVSDPDAPLLDHEAFFENLPGTSEGLFTTDSCVLVGGDYAVRVFDSRGPGDLVPAMGLAHGGKFPFTHGDWLYSIRTAPYGARLVAWDLSNPYAPVEGGEVPLTVMQGFVVVGDHAYQEKTGLVLDLSVAGQPSPAGNFSLGNPGVNTMDRIIPGSQYLLVGNTRSSAPFEVLHWLPVQGGTGEVSAARDDTPAAAIGLGLRASPNPFNPRVELRFELPAAAETSIEFFDVRGHQVATLETIRREAGLNRVTWNGTGGDGRALPSGVYLARVLAGELSETVKLVLAR